MGQIRNDGEQLQKLLRNKEISIDDAAKMYFDKPRATMYNLLKKKKFSKSEIALTCILFQLKPDFFGLSKEYFSTPFNRHSLVDFVCFSSPFSVKKSPIQITQEYFELVSRYVGKANQKVSIYDYISRDEEMESPLYRKSKREYYKLIEKGLKDKKFKIYEKVVALPLLGTKISHHSSLFFDEMVKQAIRMLYTETFNHIIRSFSIIQNNNCAEFSFYIVNPTRLYNYTLVDDNFIISTYDKFNDIGISNPDMVFVEEVGSKKNEKDHISTLWTVYEHEFKAISNRNDKPHSRRVTIEKFVESTDSAFRDLKDEMSVIEKKLLALKEKFAQGNRSVIDEIEKSTLHLERKKRELVRVQKHVSSLVEIGYKLK